MLEKCVRDALVSWQAEKLRPKLYPESSVLIPTSALMGDEIIDQLATCGERLSTGVELSRRTRWMFAFVSIGSQELSDIGRELLDVVSGAYVSYDRAVEEQEAEWTCQPAVTAPIPVAQFYGSMPVHRTLMSTHQEAPALQLEEEQQVALAEQSAQGSQSSRGTTRRGRGSGRSRGRGKCSSRKK